MENEIGASDPVPATWGYTNPDAKVSIEDFEVLIGEAYALKKDKKAFEDQAEKVGELLKEKQIRIQAIMEQLGKEKYKSDHGTVSLTTSLSVATPKTPEQKTAFFAWLEQQELFDEYATVDSKKLNSLFNSLANGDPEFRVPGIEKPKLYSTLKLLK